VLLSIEYDERETACGGSPLPSGTCGENNAAHFIQILGKQVSFIFFNKNGAEKGINMEKRKNRHAAFWYWLHLPRY